MKETGEKKALERQQMILEVLSGRRTATDAAAALGMSRKTYYQWQERALDGMLKALEELPPGRPAKETDPQQEALLRQVADLRKEKTVLESRLKIQSCMRQVIDEMLGKNPETKKK
jgi:transposase-like protein